MTNPIQRVKTPHQLAMQGKGKHRFTQCALCHGTESGTTPQSFPVGVGRHSVAGYRICDNHATLVEQIAAKAGIVWPGIGLAREYGLSVLAFRGTVGDDA